MPEDPTGTLSLRRLNRMTAAEFAAALAGLFEGSSWVAQQACARRPFADSAQLLNALCEIVRQSPPAQQLALLRAHPELGTARTAAAMSATSRREQSGAGLDRDDAVLLDRLAALNRAYRERFGFPFIIAVRGMAAEDIPAQIEQRLAGNRAVEIGTALGQVCRIAEFRLRDLLS